MLTSHFSHTAWWIAALVAGAVAALAFQSLIWEKKHRWAAIVFPAGGALGIVLDSALRGYEGDTPLQLFTVAMLGLALTRVVFAGYIRRQYELVRAGQPVQEVTWRHVAAFVTTLMAIMLGIAFTL
ncbi:hypothetical protein RVN83_15440 [Streptomyces sp. PU10]|uniref:hypothetical protein n=1 Tax=Streptomyces TaxID=1883 RepID=UPI0018D84DE4|nr:MULTISPECIES: hypothetical protein [unclassified Streptomyces]MBH5129395.1 hypothetical protein [Streptomyces sp. HB-N217]MDU0254560.1 hypothetical protein [Streptomyces sp. PU10]WSU03046.1 hypothetical protein OG368_21585 [Streptomyces sp. NBC_01124]